MAMSAWAAKLRTSAICLLVKGSTSGRTTPNAPTSSFSLSIGTKKGPGTGQIDERSNCRIAVDVTLFSPQVGNMNDILGSSEAGEGDIRSKVANHPHSLASRLGISGRFVVQRGSAKRL